MVGDAGGRRPAIYTRTGDGGSTGLLYGGRVAKDDPIPIACGDVDEAQAAIGLARAANAGRADGIAGTVAAGSDHSRSRSTAVAQPAAGEIDLDAVLIGVARDLWVLMAELATPANKHQRLVAGSTRVSAAMVELLEQRIDDLAEGFTPPAEFVVPGSDIVAAHLDMARCVVRRAERSALAVAAGGSLIVPYLNRLSDLLWTLARRQEGTSLVVRDVQPDDPNRDKQRDKQTEEQ